MTDKDGAPVDPRYDPAFQRGFVGEVATGPYGRAALRRTAAVNPAPAQAAQTRPATLRIEDFSPAPVAPLQLAPTLAAESDAATHDGSQRDAAPARPAVASPRELARNPFIIALAVLAAVLIASGAIWAYQGFATIIKHGTRNAVEFWAAQTMSFGAPLAIVVGIAMAGVLLVLFGWSWQRSRN